MQKIPRREDADNTRCLPQNFAQTLFPVYPGYDGCLVRTWEQCLCKILGGGGGGGRVNRLYCKQCENGKFWSLPSVPLALVLLWRREKEEKDEVIYLSCSPYRLVISSWFLLKNFHAKRRPLVLLATVPMIWIMSCVRTILSSKACFSNLKIKLN